MAVQKGDNNCIAYISSGVLKYLRNVEQEHLEIIVDDIFKNNYRLSSLLDNFVLGNKVTELAFFTEINFLGENSSPEKTNFSKRFIQCLSYGASAARIFSAHLCTGLRLQAFTLSILLIIHTMFHILNRL